MRKVNRKKQIGVTLLSTVMLMTPVYSFAVGQDNVNTKNHEVLVEGSDLNVNLVRPDQTFNIFLDTKSKEFKKVRQQLENQSFGILLASNKGEKIFLDAKNGDALYGQKGTIEVKNHPLLERYTSYQATILVKSDYQQAKKGKYPTVMTNTVSFKTGSDLHEPTKISLLGISKTPSVLDAQDIQLKVTDDYGLSGYGLVTIETTESGARLLDSVKVSEKSFQLDEKSEDIKVVSIENHEAEKVSLNLRVLGEYGEKSTTTSFDFQPGETEEILLRDNGEYVVGKTHSIEGTAKDRYGNNVKDGVEVRGESLRGTITTDKTLNGKFELNYQVSTKKGMDGIKIISKDSGKVIEEDVYNRADHPAKVILETIDIKKGELSPIKFKVLDQYDNPVEDGEEITLSFEDEVLPSQTIKTKEGLAEFEITPKDAGELSFEILSESSGFQYKSEKPLIVSEDTLEENIGSNDMNMNGEEIGAMLYDFGDFTVRVNGEYIQYGKKMIGSHLFDGDKKSKWTSDAFAGKITIEMKDAKVINSINFFTETGQNMNVLLYDKDNQLIENKKVYVRKNIYYSPYLKVSQVIDTKTPIKRIVITAQNSNEWFNYFQLTEMELNY